MNGREVFRHAVTRLAEAVDEALAANQLTRQDIDWLVPHQANRRIIDGMGRKLGLAAERVVVTVDRHANTSAASVPLALNEAWRDGRIKRGDLVLLEALGGGLAWGLTQRFVRDSILLSDESISLAQRWLWDQMRLALEPAAALPLAALQTGAWKVRSDDRVCLVLCGGNVDLQTLV